MATPRLLSSASTPLMRHVPTEETLRGASDDMAYEVHASLRSGGRPVSGMTVSASTSKVTPRSGGTKSRQAWTQDFASSGRKQSPSRQLGALQRHPPADAPNGAEACTSGSRPSRSTSCERERRSRAASSPSAKRSVGESRTAASMRKRIEHARQAGGVLSDTCQHAQQEAMLNEYANARGSVQERMQLLVSQLHSERNRAQTQQNTMKPAWIEAKGAPPPSDEHCATARPTQGRFLPATAAGTLPRDVDPEQLLLREELKECRRLRDEAQEEVQAVKLENFRLYGQVRSIHASGGDQHHSDLLVAAQRQRVELEAERRDLEFQRAELSRLSEELYSDAGRSASKASGTGTAPAASSNGEVADGVGCEALTTRQRAEQAALCLVGAASQQQIEQVMPFPRVAGAVDAVHDELERERALRKAAQGRETKLLAQAAGTEAARAIEDAVRIKDEADRRDSGSAAEAAQRLDMELQLQTQRQALQDATLQTGELETARREASSEAALCEQAVARESVHRQVLQHIETQLAPLLGGTQPETFLEVEPGPAWACGVMGMVGELQALLTRSQTIASQESKRAQEAENDSQNLEALAAEAASRACQQVLQGDNRRRQSLDNMEAQMLQASIDAFQGARASEAEQQLRSASADKRRFEQQLREADSRRDAALRAEADLASSSQRALNEAEAELAAANARSAFDCKRADDLQDSMQKARRDSMAQVLATSEKHASIQTQLNEAGAKLASERRKVADEEAKIQQVGHELAAAEAMVRREASAHEETRQSFQSHLDSAATVAARQSTAQLVNQHELQLRLDAVQLTAAEESSKQLQAQRHLQERLNAVEAAAAKESRVYQESLRLFNAQLGSAQMAAEQDVQRRTNDRAERAEADGFSQQQRADIAEAKAARAEATLRELQAGRSAFDEAKLQQMRNELSKAKAKAAREADAHEESRRIFKAQLDAAVVTALPMESARSSSSDHERARQRTLEQFQAQMSQASTEAFQSLRDNVNRMLVQEAQPNPAWQLVLQETERRFELQLEEAKARAAKDAAEQQVALQAQLAETSIAAAKEQSALQVQLVEARATAEKEARDTIAQMQLELQKADRARGDEFEKLQAKDAKARETISQLQDELRKARASAAEAMSTSDSAAQQSQLHEEISKLKQKEALAVARAQEAEETQRRFELQRTDSKARAAKDAAEQQVALQAQLAEKTLAAAKEQSALQVRLVEARAMAEKEARDTIAQMQLELEISNPKSSLEISQLKTALAQKDGLAKEQLQIAEIATSQVHAAQAHVATLQRTISQLESDLEQKATLALAGNAQETERRLELLLEEAKARAAKDAAEQRVTLQAQLAETRLAAAKEQSALQMQLVEARATAEKEAQGTIAQMQLELQRQLVDARATAEKEAQSQVETLRLAVSKLQLDSAQMKKFALDRAEAAAAKETHVVDRDQMAAANANAQAEISELKTALQQKDVVAMEATRLADETVVKSQEAQSQAKDLQITISKLKCDLEHQDTIYLATNKRAEDATAKLKEAHAEVERINLVAIQSNAQDEKAKLRLALEQVSHVQQLQIQISKLESEREQQESLSLERNQRAEDTTSKLKEAHAEVDRINLVASQSNSQDEKAKLSLALEQQSHVEQLHIHISKLESEKEQQETLSRERNQRAEDATAELKEAHAEVERLNLVTSQSNAQDEKAKLRLAWEQQTHVEQLQIQISTHEFEREQQLTLILERNRQAEDATAKLKEAHAEVDRLNSVASQSNDQDEKAKLRLALEQLSQVEQLQTQNSKLESEREQQETLSLVRHQRAEDATAQLKEAHAEVHRLNLVASHSNAQEEKAKLRLDLEQQSHAEKMQMHISKLELEKEQQETLSFQRHQQAEEAMARLKETQAEVDRLNLLATNASAQEKLAKQQIALEQHLTPRSARPPKVPSSTPAGQPVGNVDGRDLDFIFFDKDTLQMRYNPEAEDVGTESLVDEAVGISRPAPASEVAESSVAPTPRELPTEKIIEEATLRIATSVLNCVEPPRSSSSSSAGGEMLGISWAETTQEGVSGQGFSQPFPHTTNQFIDCPLQQPREDRPIAAAQWQDAACHTWQPSALHEISSASTDALGTGAMTSPSPNRKSDQGRNLTDTSTLATPVHRDISLDSGLSVYDCDQTRSPVEPAPVSVHLERAPASVVSTPTGSCASTQLAVDEAMRVVTGDVHGFVAATALLNNAFSSSNTRLPATVVGSATPSELLVDRGTNSVVSQPTNLHTEAGSSTAVIDTMAALARSTGVDIGLPASARSHLTAIESASEVGAEVAAAQEAVAGLRHLLAVETPVPVVACPLKMSKTPYSGQSSKSSEEGLLSQAKDLSRARHMVIEAMQEVDTSSHMVREAMREVETGSRKSSHPNVIASRVGQQVPMGPETKHSLVMPPRPPSRGPSDNGMASSRSSRSASQVDEAMQDILQRISSREQASRTPSTRPQSVEDAAAAAVSQDAFASLLQSVPGIARTVNDDRPSRAASWVNCSATNSDGQPSRGTSKEVGMSSGRQGLMMPGLQEFVILQTDDAQFSACGGDASAVSDSSAVESCQALAAAGNIAGQEMQRLANNLRHEANDSVCQSGTHITDDQMISRGSSHEAAAVAREAMLRVAGDFECFSSTNITGERLIGRGGAMKQQPVVPER